MVDFFVFGLLQLFCFQMFCAPVFLQQHYSTNWCIIVLSLQVLTAKCLGRRVCRDCGKNFNVADIMLPASNGQPEVRMPPLNPPENCQEKMEIRSDDNLETINNRIDVSSNVTLSTFVQLSHTVNTSSYLSRYLSNNISSIVLISPLTLLFHQRCCKFTSREFAMSSAS